MSKMKMEIKHCSQPLIVSSWTTCYYLAMMSMMMTLSTVSGATVVNLTELTQQTTNDSLTVAYDIYPSADFNQANYSITVSSSPRQIKYLAAQTGRETFSGLSPGSSYLVTANINFTQDSTTIKIVTKPNDPEIVCIPTNTSLTVQVNVLPSALSQVDVTCAPQCTPHTNTSVLNNYNKLTTNFTYEATFTDLQYNHQYNINVIMKASDGLNFQTSSAQVTCITIEKAPETVRSLMTTEILPYAVTLSWKKPYRPNGIIRFYIVSYIQVQDSTDRGTYNTLTADTWYTVPNLTPGRNYTLSVSGFTVEAGEPVSISVTTPIGTPPVNASVSPVSDVGDTSSDHVTVTLINPFSDKNGPITGYTVVVSLTTNPLPADDQLATWRKAQQSTMSQLPYASIYHCVDLFTQGDSCWKQQSSRRRRATTQGQTVTVTLGGDSQCPDSSTVYCNGPLNPSTTYYIAIRAYTFTGYTDSAFSQPVTTGPTNIIRNIIIGVVVGVGGAILIAVIVVVILVCLGVIGSKDNSQPTLTDIYNMGDRPSHKIRNSDFGSQFDKMLNNDNAGFHSEYQKVEEAGKEMETVVGSSHPEKNRSPDVIPYDHSRVKLAGSEDEDAGFDYINASWIPGQSSLREYIATQVPLDNTVDDLWRMIWEQRVNFVIVAALPRQEKRNSSLDHFLPSATKEMRVGHMTIRFIRATAASDWTVREFQLEVGEQTRDLRLLTFDAWSEENSQPPVESLAKFVNHFRSQNSIWDGHPIVVLCSYGVGPTSVIIAMDRLIQQASKTKTVDVFGTVFDMRLHRMKMVDTENLYVFLYRATLFAIKNQFPNAYKPWGGQTNGK